MNQISRKFQDEITYLQKLELQLPKQTILQPKTSYSLSNKDQLMSNNANYLIDLINITYNDKYKLQRNGSEESV